MSLSVITNNGTIVIEGKRKSDAEELSQNITKLNQAGFKLYCDESHLITFINSSKDGVGYQLYATYNGIVKGNFNNINKKISKSLKREGWSDPESQSSASSIYTNLVKDPEKYISEEDVKRVRDTYNKVGNGDRPVEISSPDIQTAVLLCKRLVQDGYNVAISNTGANKEIRRSNIINSDIIIVPNSGKLGNAIKNTKLKINEKSINKKKEKIKNDVKGLSAIELAQNLRKEGVGESVGYIIEPVGDIIEKNKGQSEKEIIRKRFVWVGVVVAIIVGILATVALGYISPILEVVRDPVYLRLSILPISEGAPGSQLPGWVLLFASIAILLAMVLPSVWHNIFDNIPSIQVPRSSSSIETGTDEIAAGQIIEDLEEIQKNHHIDQLFDDGFNEILDNIFGNKFEIKPIEKYNRERRNARLIGFGTGAGLAGITLAIIGIVVLVMVELWTLLLNLAVLAAVLVVGYRTVKIGVNVGKRATQTVASGVISLSNVFRRLSIPIPSVGDPGRFASFAWVLVISLAGLAVGLMGWEAWAAEEGLAYHLITGVVMEAVGQTPLNPWDAMFFFVTGAIVSALISLALDNRKRLTVVGLPIGVGVGSAAVIYRSALPANEGHAGLALLIGLLFGGLAVFTERENGWGVGVVRGALILLVFGVVLERLLANWSWVVYEAGSFSVQSLTIPSLAVEPTLETIALLVSQLFLAGVGLFVLFDYEQGPKEVLILEPAETNQGLIAVMIDHFCREQSDEYTLGEVQWPGEGSKLSPIEEPIAPGTPRKKDIQTDDLWPSSDKDVIGDYLLDKDKNEIRTIRLPIESHNIEVVMPIYRVDEEQDEIFDFSGDLKTQDNKSVYEHLDEMGRDSMRVEIQPAIARSDLVIGIYERNHESEVIEELKQYYNIRLIISESDSFIGPTDEDIRIDVEEKIREGQRRGRTVSIIGIEGLLEEIEKKA